MRASRATSLIALINLAFSNAAMFNPIHRRPANETNLTPWVSVNSDGKVVATITPILKTIDGKATTISVAPVTSIDVTSAKGNKEASNTAALPEPTAAGSFEVCRNTNKGFAPFCIPRNESRVEPGGKYYGGIVTWDTTFFTKSNGSILIQANYVNNSEGGPQAFQSEPILNSLGFLSWTIDKSWMKGKSSNNITLYIVPIETEAKEPQSFKGPTVQVGYKGPFRQNPAAVPDKQSLYIALPTVFGFILLCVCGGCIINRKRRQIGLGNVMSRRKGYGVGKSRSQRLGLGRKEKNGSAIMLRDQKLKADGQYRDVPVNHEGGRGRTRTDSDLGSLTGSPVAERTNYFLDEAGRDEQGRS